MPPPSVSPPTPVCENVASRRGEAQGLRGPVQRTERRAALHPGAPRDRIDGDAAQRGEVDHEPAVRDGETGDVVAAATDTDLQVALTGRAHRGDDIADRGAPDDQLRAVVDHPVPDRPGGVVPAAVWSEDLAVEVRTANGGGEELRCSGHDMQVPRNRSS
jgi:hypothetical protein